MTQGYEATHSGKFLEGLVRREFAARGFHFRGFGDDQNNLDMFAPRIVIHNAPYQSLYGCQSRSEFLIIDGSRKIRVECRWQESSGSVDEKYPYLLRNAVECMPEHEILILHGGDGARREAIDWLQREAAKIRAKKIYVVNINGFLQWVRKEIMTANHRGAAE
jgi:hypothetical protein